MPRRSARTPKKLHPLLESMESEPIRQDWLRLTPGQRLIRAWRMRRFLKDPERAHDEKSLPKL
ncbi:MAG: hypothetical protein HYY18_10215 [Planctomycetes bacterium]|nr:hypothetical protein [Planctomycetota bacterium]